MVMIRICEHLITKANVKKSQAKMTAWLLVRTVTEKSIAQNRRSWVLLHSPFHPHGQVDKRYGQIV
jgi:hypothetical protein